MSIYILINFIFTGIILLILKLSTVFGKLYATSYSHVDNGHSVLNRIPLQPIHVHLYGSEHAQSVYSMVDTILPRPSLDKSYYYRG